MRRDFTVGRGLLYAAELGLLALLLAHRDPVAEAVRQGLSACARSVIPALFPCFAAVSLAINCGLGSLLPPGLSAFVTGALGGYPTGARTVGQLYKNGTITEGQARLLVCCCNNAGPGFILGVAGTTFPFRGAGAVLWAVHLLPPLVFFLLLKRGKPSSQRALPPLDVPAAFVDAVTGAAEAMVPVCGFVVLFSVVVDLLSAVTSHPLILGSLELTWGVLRLSGGKNDFVVAAALLGWGGASVHCQTAAVLAETPLVTGRYLLWKLLHGALSALLAAAVVPILWPD